MKRLIDFLAPLGVVVILASQAWSLSGRSLPGQERYYLIGGAALILFHLVLRFEQLVALVGRRQLRYGGNAFVFALLVLAIVVAVNWIAFRNTKRWDLTKNQRYSLSDQTKKVLAALKEDVTVTYFQRAANIGSGADRLKDYEAISSHIKVEFVDPVKKPQRARDLEVTTVPTLVVQRGGQREKISNDSEQDITNALIKVTREAKKTVCFVAGEGEKDIDDSSERGLSTAKSSLGKSQYETRRVVLLQEGKLPDQCTVVVLAGPDKDPLPSVIETLRSYVKAGGKALVMIEPELKNSYANLVGLLKEWNIEAGSDIVLDVSLQSQLAGTGPLMPLAATYPYHEITKDFRYATAFQEARSMKAGSASIEGVRAQNLVETSPQSWAETDLKLKEPVALNVGKDTKGPISLAVVATIKVAASPAPAATPSPAPSPSPDSAEKKEPEARVVAFGDSDFATNAYLNIPGNQDLFLNTVAWLAQDADLISIRGREPEDQRLFLTGLQQRMVFLLALAFLPGFFVVFGIVNWWRRR